MLIDTSYQIIPTRDIVLPIREHLDALAEYDIDLDYLLSNLGTVIGMSTTLGHKHLSDNFREEYGVLVECDFHENTDFVEKLEGSLDHVSAVVEIIIDALEILYVNLYPCLMSISAVSGTIVDCNFNFIKWIGDDVLIATTHFRTDT